MQFMIILKFDFQFLIQKREVFKGDSKKEWIKTYPHFFRRFTSFVKVNSLATEITQQLTLKESHTYLKNDFDFWSSHRKLLYKQNDLYIFEIGVH